ncbi:hypothetical protein pdam_00010496 [Pocillopora damicornis]|uniref:Uncharacterized protein n=1 Tax=Pocillopora damicornis TaxID=46731 RepID=A0A3M6V145_POCDA|nr:hypothetical protein pdam_00010496 [Pocillopora damicornis]
MLQIALRCVVQDAIQTKYANKNSGRNPVENVDTVLEASPVMTPFTLRDDKRWQQIVVRIISIKIPADLPPSAL